MRSATIVAMATMPEAVINDIRRAHADGLFRVVVKIRFLTRGSDMIIRSLRSVSPLPVVEQAGGSALRCHHRFAI